MKNRIESSDWHTALNEAKRRIGHTTDGPVTRFVAISRACELCSIYAEPATVVVIANALDDILNELPSDPDACGVCS